MIWVEVLSSVHCKNLVFITVLFQWNWKFFGVHLFQLACNFSEFSLLVSHCYLQSCIERSSSLWEWTSVSYGLVVVIIFYATYKIARDRNLEFI